MSNLFDDLSLGTQDGLKQPIKPFYTVDKQNLDAVRRWLKNAYEILMQEAKPRFDEMKENFKMYKGALLNKSKSSANQRTLNEQDALQQRIKDQKLYVNLLYDVTEQRVSKLMRFKPAVSIMPANAEHEDRISAQVAKAVLDTIWYENNIDRIIRDLERGTAIAGEWYVAAIWNPDKGDLHPEYVKMRDAGQEVVINQGEGEEKEIKVNTPIRIGDVDFDLKPAWRILNERKDHYSKCDWQICIEYKDIDELKQQFPEQANKIKEIPEYVEGYDDEQLKELRLRNQTLVLKMYHRKTKYLPEGAYVMATLDTVLVVDDAPYNYEGLPYLRLTDIDVPQELNGVSFYRNVKGLQFQHYNLSSMIIANQRLTAYPKWMVPEGTVNTTSLGNDRTIVQYRGPQAPRLEQANPTPAEVFNFREKLAEELRILSGGSPQERGQPPAGVTAAVALQFLAEEEAERYNTAIAKHNDVIKELAKRTLAVAADNYDPSDGRMLRVLGTNNKYDVRFFDVANLNKPYDVRVSNSSSLPESKSAKIQTIVDLNKEFQGLFSPEQVIDMLELGDVNKFNSIAAAAVRSAESIYEDLVQGRPVMEPKPYENLILHWQTLIAAMQDRNFKEQVPEDRREAVIDYVRALEMLMYNKSIENPTFAARLQTLELYPVAFVLPPPMMPAPAPLPEEQAIMAGKMSQELPPGDVMAEAAALPPLENQLTPDQIAMDPNEIPTGEPRDI